MPLRRTVRGLVTASFVTPPFLGAIAWELLAAPNSGLLNKIYRAVTGAPQDEYLFNILHAPGLIFVISCYTFPFVFVLVANRSDRSRAISRTPRRFSGGNAWTTARRVTIPLAMPPCWRRAGRLPAGHDLGSARPPSWQSRPASTHDDQDLEPVPVPPRCSSRPPRRCPCWC